MSLALVVFLLVVIAVAVGIATLSLCGINRLYRIQGNSLGLSALVVFCTFLTSGIISAFAIRHTSIAGLLSILSLIAVWSVGYFLYKKFFRTTIGTFLAVFATYTVFWIALTLFLALPIRYFLLEPVQLQADSMAPTFHKGEYIFFEKWDKVPRKGEVVLVSIPCPNGQGTCRGVRRVSAVAGDVVDGTQVPNDACYIAADSQPSTSVKVKADAVIGKLFLDLGQTGTK